MSMRPSLFGPCFLKYLSKQNAIEFKSFFFEKHLVRTKNFKFDTPEKRSIADARSLITFLSVYRKLIINMI